MKSIAIAIGALALVGTILPPVLFLNGAINQDLMKQIMLIACIPWFLTAPLWMKAN
jgi:hypothetical protein